jgi:hypothetical protein
VPKILYKEHRFGAEALLTIQRTNQIAADYAAQGFSLTLRQIYYQMVSRDWIPNNLQSYSRLGDIISDARLAGRIDWNTVVDRTRNLATLAHWGEPQDIINGAANQFRYDLWEDQPTRVEVWVEKDALSDVVRHACQPLDVPYMACRGYMSQSEMWAAGRRLRQYLRDAQDVVIIHLGDHDPSGVDMTRDIADRLSMFAESDIEVNRIALNMDQIEEFNPPPNPAKITDSRSGPYIELYGTSSWELDAIEPATLSQLIADTVENYIDEDAMAQARDRQDDARADIAILAQRWEEVMEYVKR